MFAHLGNGATIYDRLRKEYGDYMMMDSRYTLVWLERSNNLNNSVEIIGRYLREKSVTPLHEYCNDYFADTETDRTYEIIEELKAKCIE